MYNVNNKKVIRNIALKSFLANKTRNIVAVIAIALTALMFTSVFTIGSVIIHSFEQSNFRQVGGYAHGSIKDVSYEDIEVLKEHELIEEYGVSRGISHITDGIFAKSPVEIKYIDEISAKLSFVDLVEGNMPKDGTKEIICDTTVLKTVGISPTIGSEITLTFEVSGKEVTDTFILSGYFQPNDVLNIGFAYTARSYADDLVLQYKDPSDLSIFGRIDMNLMLKDASSIEGDIITIIEDSGYQAQDEKTENYLGYGVNWGYVSAQTANMFDLGTISFAGILFLVFMLTGYLIIFNIFKISVANDIRFYGLLKTIGTTSKQIRKVVRMQGLFLSVIGIPIGLILGYIVGCVIAPLITSTLNTYVTQLTINPYIFVGGAVFSFVTVLLSCNKPAKIASKVAPIEAVRYTEVSVKTKAKRRTKKATPVNMAMANMNRNRGKTFVVVISLALAILILHMTILFTSGFSMEKYLGKHSVADFLIGHTKYLNSDEIFGTDIALSDEDITILSSLEGVINSGIVYGNVNMNMQVAEVISGNQVTIYIMDDYALEKLNITDGNRVDGIIAVYLTDDYGNIKENSNTKKVGDTLDLRFATNWNYVELGDTYKLNAIEYTDESFEVTATSTLKHNMGYRTYYGQEIFIIPYDLYSQNIKNIAAMNLLLDIDEEYLPSVESVLANYTTTLNPNLGFESTASIAKEFEAFRNMFLMVGGLLSIIVGFIGILNFFNVILTSINTRKREFAVLQSMGMTGLQLKQMLIFESISYIALTIIVSAVFAIITTPMLSEVLSGMFWFYEANFTILPLICVIPLLLLIGIYVPTILYKTIQRKSIVERLREIG